MKNLSKEKASNSNDSVCIGRKYEMCMFGNFINHDKQ